MGKKTKPVPEPIAVGLATKNGKPMPATVDLPTPTLTPEARNAAYSNYYANWYRQYAAQFWRSIMPSGAYEKMVGRREELAARKSCRTCHVKSAAMYVALLELIFVGVVLSVFIQYYLGQESQHTFLLVGFIISLVCGVCSVFMILSLLVGVCRDAPILLVPHLVAQVVGICVMTGIGALILLMTFTGVKFHPAFGPSFSAILIAIAILCLGMSLAEVWFFFLVRDCYLYLKRKEDFRMTRLAVERAQRAAEAGEHAAMEAEKQKAEEAVEGMKAIEGPTPTTTYPGMQKPVPYPWYNEETQPPVTFPPSDIQEPMTQPTILREGEEGTEDGKIVEIVETPHTHTPPLPPNPQTKLEKKKVEIKEDADDTN